MYAIGLLCGLISGLLYACMILTSRYLKGYYIGTAQAVWAIIITLVIFLPYSTAISFGVLLDNLYLLILLGLLLTAAGLTLYYSCVFSYVRAQNASIIALLEPASAVVLAAIILSQPITSSVLVGGGLILLGALVVSGAGAVHK